MTAIRLSEEQSEDQSVLDLIRVIRLCRPNRPGAGCLLFDPNLHIALNLPEWVALSTRIHRMRERHSQAWWAWVKTDEAREARRHFLRVHELTAALRLREVEVDGRMDGLHQRGNASSVELTRSLALRIASSPHPRPLRRFAEQVVETPELYSHVTLLAVFYAAFNHRAEVALGAWHFAEWKAGMRPFYQCLSEDGVVFPEGVTADDVDHFLADNPGGFLHHIHAWTAGGEVAGMSISSALHRDV